MNLLLFQSEELDAQNRVSLTGRRARHVLEVLRSQPQDALRAGVVGGKVGKAWITEVGTDTVSMRFEPLNDPPPPLPLKLVLALPRPKVLRRVLADVTSLGIKEIYLVNAYRVEKAYWSSEQVTQQYLKSSCLLGLEQARDTVLPSVHLVRLFKPFVEDRLGEIAKGTSAYVAHPGVTEMAPPNFSGPTTLAIGPEGGFIPYEVDLLCSVGFKPIQLGERILKFETAITVLAGRMLR